jgi:PAS domain S-box-containing protein
VEGGALLPAGGQPEDDPTFQASVLEKVLPSVIITDLAGNITYWNKRAEEMRGWKREEVIGKPILSVVPPESRELIDAIMKRAARSGSWTGELEAIRKDGTRFPTLSNDAALEDSSGRVVGMIDVSLDITERNDLDRRLRESEAKFRAIAESSFDSVFMVDTEGILSYASPAIHRILGYTPEEVIGTSMMKYVAGPAIPRALQALSGLLGGNQIEPIELELRKKDGSPAFVEIGGFPLYDGREITGLGGITRDISERKRAEGERRLLSSIIQFSGDAILGWGLDFTITTWNRAAELMYGYSPEEIIGQPPSLLEPSGRAGEMISFTERVRGGKVVKVDTTRVAKDGRVIDVAVTVSPVIDASGRFVGVSSISREVTERTLMGKRLAESEAKFRGIADRSYDAIFMVDAKGRYSYVSPAIRRITGYTPQELVGTAVVERFLPSIAPRFTQAFEKLLRGETLDAFEIESRRKDGSPIFLKVSAYQVFDDANSVAAVQGIIRDVTDSRQAEATRKLLASIVESSPIGMVSFGLDGTVISWNPAAERFFGYSTEDVIGRPLMSLAPHDSLSTQLRFMEEFKKVKEGMVAVHIQSRLARKDGSLFDASLDVFPIMDASGNVTRVSVFFSDITQQKASEAKVRDLQEARSRFVSAAAHELKTPLVSIKGYSDLAASGSLGKLPESLEHGMEIIGRNTNRMLILIKELLEVERLNNGLLELSKEAVDLNEVVRDSVDNLRPIINGKKLEVAVVLTEGAHRVMGEKVRLLEVMDNLLVNAIKFTPEKGKLLVVVEESAAQVRVAVTDTGIGISPTNMQSLFEPFSKIAKSASAQDQQLFGLYSTGLGLSVTKMLVELHGGRIWAESEGEGKGTTFFFTIPSASR